MNKNIAVTEKIFNLIIQYGNG